ncbi:VanZ family protein [Paenibacillus sp. MWE-103]|uniref:VanZ family protein n=1 Tax=Paenibacillus artemisiicola TaxID=1172618 RepID=A0ABS3WBT7_9BACL|nr:VanZ family protein [Paenibacillus artemisiicola]MBO7745570.1 VanZ family protein [Paenibacillus artemisiicola]
MKKAIALITAAYALLLFYWMFIGFGRTNPQLPGYNYNVMPLHTIRLYFVHADSFRPAYWAVNIVGNVAVFAPFGLSLPYLFRLRLFSFTAFFVCVLFLLETFQLLLQRGSFDIDDILLNTLGALLGYATLQLIRKRVSA